ncbi:MULTISPECIES: MATE family efflux transporter [unclassified Thermosipho (in: thermotogales)]|uniref:MATE family efflux transporter n=1 Tax=unclassified Thermosipho (in: thermotogales) TaxID=2676525 RepID=UPI001E2915D8|nr:MULTISPECIES: MATE family efflux transporter [unclassified Thermosipho (in: thermotogales)]
MSAKDLFYGNILKQIIVMGLPTAIGFSFQMFYDLVDLYWIGKISTSAIAGVGIFSTIFWVVEALNEIIGVSSISLISQSYGKRNVDRTNSVIEQTIAFKFLVAIVGSVVLLLFLKPIFYLFTNERNVLELGLKYGYLRIFFLPIMFSSFSINTAFRSIGDSKTPMIIMIISSILNIILDPILMFDKIFIFRGFNLGVSGAAIATIISQVFSFVVGFYILFSGVEGVRPRISGLFRLDFEIDKKLITIGLPNGFEVLMRNLSGVMILYFVSKYGKEVISAYTIGNRIFGFAFMPLFGILMGSSAIVGQSLGAEKVERAERVSKIAGWLTTIVSLIFVCIIVIFSKEFIDLFSNDYEVIKNGVLFLRYSVWGLLFLAYGLGISIAFTGSGYNIPFLFMSLISRWIVQIPLMYFVVMVFKLPVIWLWISFAFGDFMEYIVSIYFFKKGKWKVVRV